MTPPPDVRRLAAARVREIAARTVPPMSPARERRLRRQVEEAVMEEAYAAALVDTHGR